MRHPDVVSGMNEATRQIAVLVPYDRQAGYLYLDAVGETRSDALAHFTSHMRFDLSLSEIFHMEFVEGSVHVSGGACLRSDLIPCILPFDGDSPFVQGIAAIEDESRRILTILKRDQSEFTYVAAALEITHGFVP